MNDHLFLSLETVKSILSYVQLSALISSICHCFVCLFEWPYNYYVRKCQENAVIKKRKKCQECRKICSLPSDISHRIHNMRKSVGTLASGMVGLAPKWVRLDPQIGQIRDFFRSDFSTFWLTEPKCTEI